MDQSDKLQQMYQLLLHAGDGVLSTISLELAGYPFGSITPYCLDHDFCPNILISSIAQHTKNVLANSKVSLTIVQEKSQTNKQASGRATYVGDALKVEDDQAIKKRYLQYFPAASEYFKAHDFYFFKIMPKRVRYIGGFGKIFWVEKAELDRKNLFPIAEEVNVVEHMNEDHQHNLDDYARFYLQHKIMDDDKVRMAGIDQYGIDLFINEVKARIDFPETLSSSSQARSQLVKMAKEAKAAL